ncbi:MAG: DUF370 domain-containing protein [Desulfatibacillum sp.]|nr:DUF370 domain-containing protein [Desulfatibacillum sp.]
MDKKIELELENRKKFWTGLRPEPLLNIGFGNTVAAHRVIAIVTPNSAPMKRLRDDARDAGRLVDSTCGRKTRAIIIMDSNHVVLSAIQAETVSQRFAAIKDKREEGAHHEPA